MSDSLLITGPPASGKSYAALERFHAHSGATLVTPTATMAEHVRHELARAGALVRPGRIVTLAGFVDGLTRIAPAPKALLHWLVEHALARVRSTRFARVAEYRGFVSAVAGLLEEADGPAIGGAFGEELTAVYRDVEAALAARGMGLRNVRLRSCDARGLGHVVFDGFFSFSRAEIELIERIAAATVTLSSAGAIRERLLSAGFAELRLETTLRNARLDAFSAPTLERETEEIARRILEHVARGRSFREIGIILRSRDPYGPAIETTLARFGIPFRSYFVERLDSHPTIRFLSGVVRAMLGGWDHAEVLSLLRMPVSGIGATPGGDAFDFAMRDKIPGAGLPLPIASGARFDKWAAEQPSLKSGCGIVPGPVVSGEITSEQAQIWRSNARALEAFGEVLDEAAEALAGRISLAEFWRYIETALSLAQLRVPDRRRNVVHLMDVYEARQWELPVVYVCGLAERQFPLYHREDPLLNDAARREAGLQTSADQQAEERFLFEVATTRATEETVLSYARFNDKGEDALPSFLYSGEFRQMGEQRVRPRPSRTPAPFAPRPIERLRDELAAKHKSLAPTSIESFLQCPFQFFAAKTLRLRPRPLAPRDRLDVRVQGSILHRALAELARMPLLGAAVFDQVFEDECRRVRVPETYRKEAVRLELRRHFEGFLEDCQFALGWRAQVEEKFSFALSPNVSIAGRIDRLEIGPGNEALVIDYKYSAGNKIRENIEQNASGNLVQGGLYMLAAERHFGLKPVGMLYCGLRKEVVWDGWHAPVAGLEAVGEARTPAGLRELIDAAASTAATTFDAIASGRIEAKPADPNKCKWCDFADACRVETLAE